MRHLHAQRESLSLELAQVSKAERADVVPCRVQTQSQEKIDLLRMLGAEVYPVPGERSCSAPDRNVLHRLTGLTG